MYYLATIVASVILMMAFGAALLASGHGDDFAPGGIVYLVSMAIGLSANLVTICLGIRRLHDMGKGGSWVLVVLIPALLSFCVYFVDSRLIINLASALDIIVIAALAIMKGDSGDNEFGPAVE